MDDRVSTERMYEFMRFESNRLKSFQMNPPWPKDYIDIKKLAKAGFFYVFSGDRVHCAFCHGEVCRWERDDDPMTEHARHFITCPFIMGGEVGNVPLGEDPLPGPKRPRAYDVCGPYPNFPPNDPRSLEERYIDPHHLLGDNREVLNNLGHGNQAPAHLYASTNQIQPRYPIHYPNTNPHSRDTLQQPGTQEMQPRQIYQLPTSEDDTTSSVISTSSSSSTSSASMAPISYNAPIISQSTISGIAPAGSNSIYSSESILPDVEARSHENGATQHSNESSRSANNLGGICKICYSNSIELLFLPCMHSASCQSCASRLQNCPFCRATITARIRHYLV